MNPTDPDTTTRATKALARQFFERLDAADHDGALALMADDATYWLAGQPGALPSAGTKTRAQMARIFALMADRMDGPLHFEVLRLVAEGPDAALEVRSLGTLKNGRVYRNEYHLAMTVAGGRIQAVREYYDTQHVHDVWFRP